MSSNPNPNRQSDRPMTYEIRIQGHIDQQWAEWFGAQTITPLDNDEMLLICQVADQAALHGVLRKVRDLGVLLRSVVWVDPDQPDAAVQD